MKIAIPTNNQKTLSPHIGLCKGFLVIDMDTNEKFFIRNPVIEKIQSENINLKDLPEGNRGLGTGRTIPPLLAEAGVDVLVADEFGEGMLRNLESEGIKAIITDKKNIDEIISDIKEGEMNINETFDARGYGRFARGFGNRGGFGRGYARGYGRRFGNGCGYGRGYGRRFGNGGGFGRGFGRFGWRED